MKKIFTLIFLAAGFMTQAAAQIEFVRDGEVIADGAEITFYAEEIELAPGYSLIDCAPNDPYIRNTGDKAINLMVTVSKTNAETDQLTWCGITEQCMPMKEASETRSCTLDPGTSKPLALHADFESGKYTSYRAQVTASAGLFGESKTIYINFVYAEAAGINGVENANSVQLKGNVLSYDLTSAQTLSVYAADGRLIKKTGVTGSGNLSLAGLPQGVYLYTLTSEKGTAASGKFILK